MTHAELVERACKWLRSRRCAVVLAEITSFHNPEIPDAIGWRRNSALSYLVECKTSRADFHRGKKRVFRRPGHPFALGKYRYYLTPKGLLKPSEIPRRWGLLEVRPKTIKTVKKAEAYPTEHYSAIKEMNVIIAELAMIQGMMGGFRMIPSGHVTKVIRGMQKAIEVNDPGTPPTQHPEYQI